MLLLKIKSYIQAQGEITLQALSNQFEIPPEAMQDMVKRWVCKGMVRQEAVLPCQTRSSGCGGCSKGNADAMDTIRYYWIN
jgi:hypothetical protein